MNCADCRFWNGDKHDREEPHHGWALDCRRHAPMPSLLITTDPAKADRAAFPKTKADDWCGDFEKFMEGGGDA